MTIEDGNVQGYEPGSKIPKHLIGKSNRWTSKTASEAGKKGGRNYSPSLSYQIKKIAGDINWNYIKLKNREEVEKNFGKNAWRALIYKAIEMAMDGDIKALNWLGDNAFGKNIKVEVDGGLFQKSEINIKVVNSQYTDELPKIDENGQLIMDKKVIIDAEEIKDEQ